MKNNIKSLKEILSDETEPPAPIVGNGILLDKTLLLIYGKPKSRKSFFALNLAIAISEGKSFAGFEIPNAQKVLVLSAEGGYFPIRKRIKTMCRNIRTNNSDNLQISFSTKINLSSEEGIKQLQDTITSLQPTVLIIDPLVRFHDAEENSASEMAKVFGNLRQLIEEHNVSIIIIHHSGKEDARGARGSSAIMGEYDSCIEIKTTELKSLLSFDMRHVETPDAKEIVFNTETFWFEEDFQDDLIRKALTEMNSQPTKKEFVDYLIKRQYYEQSGAYKAIDRAQRKGVIRKTDQGQYSLN